MFEDLNCKDWIDEDIMRIIENEIVYDEDIDDILYDEDWELFKMKDFYGGDADE